MKTSKEASSCSNAFLVLCLFFVAVSGSSINDKKYLFLQNRDSLSENERTKLMILTWPVKENIEGCEMLHDQELVNEVLRSIKNPLILKVNDEQINHLMDDCSEISQRRKKRESLDFAEGSMRSNINSRHSNQLAAETARGFNTTVESHWYSIFPDTKWCGEGNVATSYDDLGEAEGTDMCCRDHDNCDDLMLSGESKYGLKNDSPYTKLSCKCDETFYTCLNEDNSLTSSAVGDLYFNLVGNECYELDYPATDNCIDYGFLHLSCKEYERDTTKPKVYQWKNAKDYNQTVYRDTLIQLATNPLAFSIETIWNLIKSG